MPSEIPQIFSQAYIGKNSVTDHRIPCDQFHCKNNERNPHPPLDQELPHSVFTHIIDCTEIFLETANDFPVKTDIQRDLTTQGCKVPR